MKRRRLLAVSVWLALTAASSTFLGMSLDGERRRLFLPGSTTPGHAQIEQRCELCHDAGEGVRESACLGCHARELEVADDSHPRRKFLDPRNATLRARIDGRACVSCHVEHRPALTGAMGVTRPADFCQACHADVGRERPTHAGLPFDGCQAAGCHNYHDNRALEPSFLADHMGEPALRAGAVVPALGRPARRAGRPLGPADLDAPEAARSPSAIAEWAGSVHARQGINCSGCHGGGERDPAAWTDRPTPAACRGCHADEVAGFSAGKHGMRHAAELPAMRPADAGLPMRADADRPLDCASCHGPHATDRRRAAALACLGCHADDHSRAYLASPHYLRFALEPAIPLLRGTGVSCATCHLPRVRRVDSERPGVAVEHNQNAALRPVETLVRPVCQGCHGVGFSLAALADPALVERNFDRAPTGEPAAFDMIRRQRAAAEEDRR